MKLETYRAFGFQHIGSQVGRDQRASWVAAFAADNVLTGFHVNNPETFPMTSTNY
ncbi:MAG: hypothetical protein GY768_14600 [Planctomycetaceae bacterium]|nr:hypothetical protein [Planctomycetaceae bacterium]